MGYINNFGKENWPQTLSRTKSFFINYDIENKVMFEFLKKIMNNENLTLTNDAYSVHRILKTDIKKDPNEEEDEIVFGCGCFLGSGKMFLETSWCYYNFCRLCWW